MAFSKYTKTNWLDSFPRVFTETTGTATAIITDLSQDHDALQCLVAKPAEPQPTDYRKYKRNY